MLFEEILPISFPSVEHRPMLELFGLMPVTSLAKADEVYPWVVSAFGDRRVLDDEPFVVMSEL